MSGSGLRGIPAPHESGDAYIYACAAARPDRSVVMQILKATAIDPHDNFRTGETTERSGHH